MRVRLIIAFILNILFFINIKALFNDKPYILHLQSYNDYMDTITDSDYVSVILFYSDSCEACLNIESTYSKFAENLFGLVRVFVINCDNIWQNSKDQIRFPICDPKLIDVLPSITFFQPPLQKLNPDTKQPLSPTQYVYNGIISKKALIDYAIDLMPAYIYQINTKAKLNKFLDDSSIPNKVILFTTRNTTSPLYKGISSEFRDRLDFAEIHEKHKQLCKLYGIKTFPTLIVLQKRISDDHEDYVTHIYSKELNFQEITDFLNEYALQTKHIREEDKINPFHKSIDKSAINDEDIIQKINIDNFESKILNTEKLVMVHAYKTIEAESFGISPKRFQGMFDYYELRCINKKNEEYAINKLNIKEFPSIIIYPLGKIKKQRIKYILSGTINIRDLTQKISDIIDNNIMMLNDTNDNIQLYLYETWRTKKPSFILFYDNDDFSMSYKVLSQLTLYREAYNFALSKNPSNNIKQQFNVNRLPLLIVIFLKDPDNENINVNDQFQVAHYNGKFLYNEVAEFLHRFLPNEEVIIARNMNKVVEINNQKDFQNYCIKTRQSCLVAILNGDKKESDMASKFNEQQELLEKIRKRYITNPISIMYLDGLCHSEILLQLNIPEEHLPNAVVYFPEKKQFSQMIGVFEYGSLTMWINNIIKGKIYLYNLPQELFIEQKECDEVHRLKQENKFKINKGTDLNSQDKAENLIKESKETDFKNSGTSNKESNKEQRKNMQIEL